MTGTNSDGATATASISVNADTNVDYVKITPDEESGIIPFQTLLKLEASFDITEEPQFTYSGPGSVSRTELDDENNCIVTINTPGLYYLTATVENDGNTYSDMVGIMVMDEAMLDALLKAKWNGMKTALIDGDKEGALTYYQEGSKERYQEIFNVLADNISAIASDMGEIELVYVNEKIAKYRIKRQETIQGQVYDITYFIYFNKGLDGIWKIESF